MNLHKELLSFFEELKEYRRLLGKSRPPRKKMEELRERLVRKSGQLSPRITELTGKQYVERWGRAYDVWSTGLTANPSAPINSIALDYCVDVTNEAIGKLEKEEASSEALDAKRSKRKAITEAARSYEQRATLKELKLILEGTTLMVIECIMNLVKKLDSRGYAYKCIPRVGDAPDYARLDKTYSAHCTILEAHEGVEHQIGTISLQLLPREKTLFKSLEPEDWDSSFGYFLNALFAEFRALRFADIRPYEPAATRELPPKGTSTTEVHRIRTAGKKDVPTGTKIDLSLASSACSTSVLNTESLMMRG